jgi:lipopolysaccharide/colanic/teichoic acid biosynthesis glycosyltransferase
LADSVITPDIRHVIRIAMPFRTRRRRASASTRLSQIHHMLKRTFDILVAAILLVVLLPALLAIALGIRLADGGPAIFRQERAGKDGRPFIFYKFRTMRLHVDPFGSSPQSGLDPRLTRVGKVLREYSIDELPQLVNIVRGDMSVVGPRPLYVSQMAEWNDRQKKRLSVRPGLTGLAQISGRGGLTREAKLELDVTYVETAGLWMDARILVATIGQVFRRKDIYEERYSRAEEIRGKRAVDANKRI